MSKKTSMFIFSLLGLLVLAAAYHLYTLIDKAGDRWPARNKSGTLTRQVAGLRADIQSLRAQEKRIPDKRDELAAVAEEFAYAARLLSHENTWEQLLLAINTKAQQSGVTLTRLEKAQERDVPAPEAGLEVWGYTASIVGTYDQIATFINRLEEFETPESEPAESATRYCAIRDFAISARDQGIRTANSGPIRHTATLMVQTYGYTGS